MTKMILCLFATLVFAVVVAPSGVGQDGVPSIAVPKDHLFPGVTNAAVTQANINTNICKANWTDTIRPPTSYTTALKREQLKTLSYTTPNPLPKVKSKSGKKMIPDLTKCKEHSANPSCWEEDHLISLQLGGDPRSPDNLWPEPWFGPWNARIKDALETKLKRMVCAGQIPLSEAQQAIATDWVAAYKKYVGPQ